MEIKNLLKSMSGVSLVEMTVVLGLMGVAAVGVMKLTDTADKAGKNIAAKDDISQFQNQLNDILKNPNNCEAALSSKTTGSSFFISQVVNGVATPKYVVEAIPANPNKVSIASMTVLNVDHNGSNGSQSLATLRVGFRKPTKGSIGGQILNKEITINANLCNKNIIQIASTAPISTLMSQCTSTSGNVRMVDGPHTWGAIKWAVCQDCSDAVVNTNTIKTCQSQGSGGGVDIGSLSELTCANQGGTWNTTTSSCNTDESSAAASCASLGGTYTAPNCLFSGQTLQALTNPTNFLNPTAPVCPPGGTYSLAVVNGKIQLNCIAPPACTSCADWAGWSLSAKGCSSGHGGVEDCRTSCTYVRGCTNKMPLGCVGAVSNQSSGPHTYLHSMGGNKYSKCSNADDGPCPAASKFGI